MSPTTFDDFTIAAPVRLLNWAGERLERVNLKPFALNLAQIATTVVRQTGLSDFGDPEFLEAARQGLGFAETEGDLNFAGRWAYRAEYLRTLSNRLRIVDTLKHEPEIASLPIRKPLFIVSFPRTGTTLLQQLLAQDPATRSPLFWQLLHPVVSTAPAAEIQGYIRTAEQFLDWSYRLAPRWQSVTPMNAHEASECIFMLPNNYGSLVTSESIGFRDWYLGRDSVPDYAYYRQLLQVLAWGQPGHRWLLKSPCHLWKLDALLNVFPDACLVQTHRHPAEMFGSWCSLAASMRKLHTNHVEPARTAKLWLEMMRLGLERAMAVRRASEPSRFFDVSYAALLDNPLDTIGSIYDHFGYPFTVEAQAAMSTWLRDNPQHKHGAHRYDLEEFSLEKDTLSQTFKEYIREFQIEETR